MIAAISIAVGGTPPTSGQPAEMQAPRIPTAAETLHKLFESHLQWRLHQLPYTFPKSEIGFIRASESYLYTSRRVSHVKGQRNV